MMSLKDTIVISVIVPLLLMTYTDTTFVTSESILYLDGDQGVDSGSCTSSNPCRSIVYAQSQSQRGDTLQLQGDFHLTKSAMMPKPLEIKGVPWARLFCDGLSTAFTFTGNPTEIRAQYSKVSNVEISGCTGPAIVYDFTSPTGPHDLRNISIHDSVAGISATYANVSIVLGQFERISQGAIRHRNAWLTVMASQFTNNTFGVYQPSCAAAIYTSESQLVISDINIDYHPQARTNDECVIIHVDKARYLKWHNIGFNWNEIPLVRFVNVSSINTGYIRITNSSVHLETQSLWMISSSNGTIGMTTFNKYLEVSTITASLFRLMGASNLLFSVVSWYPVVKGPIITCAAGANVVTTEGPPNPVTSADVICGGGCSLKFKDRFLCPSS